MGRERAVQRKVERENTEARGDIVEEREVKGDKRERIDGEAVKERKKQLREKGVGRG